MTDERPTVATVLVVDDSLVVRTLLRRQLEEQGHNVVEAADGEAALDRCAAEPPDIILLDVEMPKLDGHGVLARLRADPAMADIPVVFLTARTTTDDVVEGLRLGAHDYLRKPFEPAELVARVSAAVRVKTLQDQLRQRNAELAALSQTDMLTGLPNRRFLHHHLASECSLARRHGHLLSVLLCDVDHFKQVNDTHGHEAGDAVLREVAARMAGASRAEDVTGRWGGEEFLVIAPFTDPAGASVLAEHIRCAVADRPVLVDGGPTIEVSISVGVSCHSYDGEALLRAADAALYEAKAGGRNRVVVASR